MGGNIQPAKRLAGPGGAYPLTAAVAGGSDQVGKADKNMREVICVRGEAFFLEKPIGLVSRDITQMQCCRRNTEK